MTYTAFFGDGEKTFAFPSIELIQELERKTGRGFFALYNLANQRQCSFSDVAETIRLGLIGGGTSPADASALVKTYVIGSSRHVDSLALALGILDAVMLGTEEKSEAGE